MKKIYTQKIIFAISLLLLALSFNACVKNQVSIKEPNRYVSRDIKSYSDLFEVFWKTMDQSYNYFYEQERIDGMDWDAIYKKYKSKFSVLKTFNQEMEFTNNQIKADSEAAKKYFEEIINPIIDRHFYVKVTLPIARAIFKTNVYSGNMKDTVRSKINRIPFNLKYNYMKRQVLDKQSVIMLSGGTMDGLNKVNLIAGPLKSNPDIHYLTFERFRLVPGGYSIELKDKYFSPAPDNKYLLSQSEIENNVALKKITDTAIRKKAVLAAINILNTYNDFYKSELVQQYNAYVSNFNKTEEISTDFIDLAKKTRIGLIRLASYASSTNRSVFPKEVIDDPKVNPFRLWFVGRMDDHHLVANEGELARLAMSKIIVFGDFYSKFLNPLHKGAIKKLIIDLRGNGGGAIIDNRFFAERFITKITNFAFQRTKQGNSRFDYTPWVPIPTKKHKFTLPKEIPIVILTDRASASMSELSTLMLKSQGPQVVSVGDYTYGATAGLGSSDLYNGGLRSELGGPYFSFFMPLMATRDFHGKVIEGIGIKPEYMVAPPTNEELAAISSSPATFKDGALEQAIKVINGL